jgi:hypothetical protein
MLSGLMTIQRTATVQEHKKPVAERYRDGVRGFLVGHSDEVKILLSSSPPSAADSFSGPAG